ncbi:copper amine oxidase [Boletus reticuloceps]|uniref:Amine oxidase n=1 Tax=Boletus reticuloceps TaxID=495285 RepID=A0A8I3A9C8_9AGAM|nr:copper amine oxidase [Boletus reticuloceps]
MLSGQCVTSTPPPTFPPAPWNPWSSLTISEIVQMQDCPFAPEQGLNLTQVKVATLKSTTPPPKEAVLNHLSSPSIVNPPRRFARVTLHHGAAQQPLDPTPYNTRAWYINNWSSPEIYSNIATVVGSKRVLNNANWACYNLAVSRREETEPMSSSAWNFNLPAVPLVDFHKFFDGENITQQDLVIWVNAGMHYLPRSEDAPNMRTTIAASSFFITPLSYFDYDVSIDSTNAILLQAPSKEGEPFSVDDYGSLRVVSSDQVWVVIG